MKSILAALAVLLSTSAALAHSSSTAYITIDADTELTYRVALRDADALLDLDANGDGVLTWGEVEDRGQDLIALAQRAIVLHADGAACSIDFGAPAYARDADTGFVAFAARAACTGPIAKLALDYRLFEGIDPSHRALLRVRGGAPQLLAPGSRIEVALADDTPPGADVQGLLVQGIGHILGGPDHLLFLLALLLPAVLVRRHGRWLARDDPRAALIHVAWIATAFTLAHSITLGLASFGIVRVPASVIEPLIAITVLLAALNNLWPVVKRRLAFVAFCFGLVHGFGFAEVLAPLELPAAELAIALLSFNTGVEVGQLIAVAVSFAVLAAARRWRGYPRWVLGGGSALVAIAASGWIVERIFDVPVFAALAG
jgi:hypothetical protein